MIEVQYKLIGATGFLGEWKKFRTYPDAKEANAAMKKAMNKNPRWDFRIKPVEPETPSEPS